MRVDIFGTDENLEIKENEITEIEVNGDIYEEAYMLEDGRWIAFDEGCNAWVMIGRNHG